MFDVMYITRPNQVNCDRLRMKFIDGETTLQTIERAKKKVAKIGGTLCHIGV